MGKEIKSIERQTDFVFDINDTNLIKGIAILFMVLHHTVGLYYNEVDVGWYTQNSNSVFSLVVLLFSTAGKVCVPLFTILSGFGLSKSFKDFLTNHRSFCSDIRFILSHLVQLYSIYWAVFLCNIIIYNNTLTKLCGTYGTGLHGIKNFILDFLGLSKLFYENGFGDWFISAIIILYIIFPVIYRLVFKFKFVVIVVSFLPWIFRPFINSLGFKTDGPLFCILAFSTGILFAQEDVLDMIKAYTKIKYKLLSIGITILLFSLRTIFSLFIDYFFAISLILFCTLVLSDIKKLNKVLVLFGKNSSNIWLSHVVIL